ncbi:MAG TPA: glycosyltransferase family 2 protein [Anaeromyxobacter sp.]
MAEAPFVSIITPLYNTSEYLAECIEGVLAQTYPDFEHLIVDNRSDDGSREIAERYASMDRRIRLVVNPEFLDQASNFNRALSLASPEAKYVKFALSDDVLFPECVARLVEVAEREPAAGLVGAYYFFGEHLGGAGVPRTVRRLGGREACRMMLVDRKFMVGSPTSVLYRADVLRARTPFFEAGRLHPDTELAYEILLEHDLGFVHQVLSFIRTDNVSISTAVKDFRPNLLDRLIVTERYAARALAPEEASRTRAAVRREYFRYLAGALFRRMPRRFWEYHRAGLASVGLALRRRDLAPGVLRELARIALDPLTTARRIARARGSAAGAGTPARPG